MAMKKSGSLLGSIMRSRDQVAAEPATPPPAPAAAPLLAEPPKAAAPAPTPAAPSASVAAAPMRLLEEAASPKPEPPSMTRTLAVPVGKGTPSSVAPSAPQLKPHRVKKSYSIKASNVEALELLAWYQDKPDSQVVDQALDLLVQTMAHDLLAAEKLRAAKADRRTAI
jgi:hypothetical protein